MEWILAKSVVLNILEHKVIKDLIYQNQGLELHLESSKF